MMGRVEEEQVAGKDGVCDEDCGSRKRAREWECDLDIPRKIAGPSRCIECEFTAVSFGCAMGRCSKCCRSSENVCVYHKECEPFFVDWLENHHERSMARKMFRKITTGNCEKNLEYVGDTVTLFCVSDFLSTSLFKNFKPVS
mmetsp:Transcript_2087/g.3818  ORF Transcript_2087/g.3818 Transcript_2087/m.3818 type:complete len:142 (+) Transcript_2087:83-508(+)